MIKFIRHKQIKTGAFSGAVNFLARWARDERGSTAIEYGLIGTLIFLAIISSAYLFGQNMSNMFNYVSAVIDANLL